VASLEGLSGEERVAPVEGLDVEDQMASAEGSGAEDQAAPAEGSDIEDQVASLEGLSGEERVAPVEGLAGGDQVASAEGLDAEDQIASVGGSDAEDQVAPVEELGAEDQVASAEGSDVEDQVASAEGSDAEDQVASAEGSDIESQVASAEGSDVEDQVVSAEGSDVENQVASAEGSNVEDQVVSAEGSDAEEQVAPVEESDDGDQGAPAERVDIEDQVASAEELSAEDQVVPVEGLSDGDQVNSAAKPDEEDQGTLVISMDDKTQVAPVEGLNEGDQVDSVVKSDEEDQMTPVAKMDDKTQVTLAEELDSENQVASIANLDDETQVNSAVDLNGEDRAASIKALEGHTQIFPVTTLEKYRMIHAVKLGEDPTDPVLALDDGLSSSSMPLEQNVIGSDKGDGDSGYFSAPRKLEISPVSLPIQDEQIIDHSKQMDPAGQHETCQPSSSIDEANGGPLDASFESPDWDLVDGQERLELPDHDYSLGNSDGICISTTHSIVSPIHGKNAAPNITSARFLPRRKDKVDVGNDNSLIGDANIATKDQECGSAPHVEEIEKTSNRDESHPQQEKQCEHPNMADNELKSGSIDSSEDFTQAAVRTADIPSNQDEESPTLEEENKDAKSKDRTREISPSQEGHGNDSNDKAGKLGVLKAIASPGESLEALDVCASHLDSPISLTSSADREISGDFVQFNGQGSNPPEGQSSVSYYEHDASHNLQADQEPSVIGKIHGGLPAGGHSELSKCDQPTQYFDQNDTFVPNVSNLSDDSVDIGDGRVDQINASSSSECQKTKVNDNEKSVLPDGSMVTFSQLDQPPATDYKPAERVSEISMDQFHSDLNFKPVIIGQDEVENSLKQIVVDLSHHDGPSPLPDSVNLRRMSDDTDFNKIFHMSILFELPDSVDLLELPYNSAESSLDSEVS
jgi:hypothetical protein